MKVCPGSKNLSVMDGKLKWFTARTSMEKRIQFLFWAEQLSNHRMIGSEKFKLVKKHQNADARSAAFLPLVASCHNTVTFGFSIVACASGANVSLKVTNLGVKMTVLN